MKRRHAVTFPTLGQGIHKNKQALGFRSGDEGGPTVEFAMVIMVFLTMVFGLVDFGRALYVYHYVSYAARDGVRFAIVRGSSCTSFITDCPTNTDGSGVSSYLKTTVLPPAINPGNLTVTATWPGGNPGCSGAVNSPGCIVKVRVQYNFSFIIPFIPRLTNVMSSTSQMVISQ
jgi:Flp pilus assembly protein TadG